MDTPTGMLRCKIGLTTFAYATGGNLQGVIEPAALTTMGYDVENRLAQHQSAAGQTNYLYYSDNLKAVENDRSGSITKLIWDGAEYLQGKI